MRVVILQPNFLPWIGVFEQIRLADVYVHFDDVQLPQGSRNFVHRVQVKTAHGPLWLTIPVKRGAKRILDARIDEAQPWRKKHLNTLRHHYARAPFFEEMIELAESLYGLETDSLAEFNITAIERIADYFGIRTRFLRSSDIPVDAAKSERLLALVQRIGGDVYLTGHGARNYLDHELFERHGVAVEYIDYNRRPYPQLHGPFDPHVTILDLIANVGREGAAYIDSPAVPWREFLAAHEDGTESRR